MQSHGVVHQIGHISYPNLNKHSSKIAVQRPARFFLVLTAMSSTIILTKIYIYKGPKSSTFYNFFYTVFYILQHDFDLNLHLHQPQNSTFYKFFLHIFYFLHVYFGSILHSTYNRAPPTTQFPL